MSVKIYKNFLAPEECLLLSGYALNNVNNWFSKGVTNGMDVIDTRYTTRKRMDAEGKKYPDEVLRISNKVREAAGVEGFPLIDGHGSDGIVISVTYQGGDVYAHKDPRSSDGLPTYRCNVLTQASEEGAELYVDGEKIEIGVGDLHCYMVSELEHYVTEAKGPTPRIMYMFGAHIPKEHWSEYGLPRCNT